MILADDRKRHDLEEVGVSGSRREPDAHDERMRSSNSSCPRPKATSASKELASVIERTRN